MKKSLLQRLGLLGVVSFLSYTAAVVFAPLAHHNDHCQTLYHKGK